MLPICDLIRPGVGPGITDGGPGESGRRDPGRSGIRAGPDVFRSVRSRGGAYRFRGEGESGGYHDPAAVPRPWIARARVTARGTPQGEGGDQLLRSPPAIPPPETAASGPGRRRDGHGGRGPEQKRGRVTTDHGDRGTPRRELGRVVLPPAGRSHGAVPDRSPPPVFSEGTRRFRRSRNNSAAAGIRPRR